MITRKKTFIIMLLFAAVLIAGCKKENSGSSDTAGKKNPNPAQDTPLVENFLSEVKSVYQLYPNTDGTFYALAQGEYTHYLLKLDANGHVQQRVELGFRARRCIVKSGENIVLVGNLGSISTPYSMYEQGYVAVYDHTMQLVTTASLTEPQYKIMLNTVKQDVQDPTLFYAGGMAVDSAFVQYPYICTLKFSEGMMTKESSKVFSGYAKYRILGMVEKQSAGQKDLILETIQYFDADHPDDHDNTKVHVVKLNYFKETSGWGHETWNITIDGPNGDSYADNNSVIADDNNVYCFGWYRDTNKPASSSNSYWHSGYVAAINWHQGQMTWLTTVSVSNKSDLFCMGQLSDGCFYACGKHSGLHYNSTKNQFGNGLVAKLNLSGDLLSYKTFGAPERTSCFNHIVKDSNGNWVVVGWSGENLGNDEPQCSGWFVKTDMSSNRSLDQEPNVPQEVSDDLSCERAASSNSDPLAE